MRTILVVITFCLYAPLVGADQIAAGGNSGGNASAYSSAAEQCGVERQKANRPINGRTLCGRAVAEMVTCFEHAQGNQSCPSGAGCGDGRDYVECKDGFMQKCGYKRVDVTSTLCRMPGAVLAYNSSTTERGRSFGHVEFLCGQDTYCSVYKEPMHTPWPWLPPAACWVPTKNGVLPIAPILPPIDPSSVTTNPDPTPTPTPTPTPKETETPRKNGGGAMDAIIPAIGILGTLRNGDSSPKPAPAGTPLPGMSTAPLVFPGTTPAPAPGATPQPAPVPVPTPGGENQNPRERVPDTRTQSTDGKIHVQGR